MNRPTVRAARSRSRLDVGDSRGEFIAIGIDFGTTFSGVSWAFSEQPNKVHEISGWPAANPSDSIEVQVPTVYDIDSGKWGYQVTRDMEPVKWFKWLLLSDEDLAMEEISRSKQLREARNQLSNHPTQLTATQLVGRYLEKLWDHTCAMVKTTMPIDDFPLRVAITIPANWPNYAQNAMREAAQLAGITTKRPIWASTLDLVQESKAASLPIIQEHRLLTEVTPGDCFVVCDAGGATVDVISFKFLPNNPSRIKERVEGVSNKSSRLEECVEGEGGLCGAVQIDEAFEAHLLGKSRLKIHSLNASEYNTVVVEGWERGIKRTFTNAKTPTEFSLRLPMKAFKTRDKLHKRDHFSVNRSEVYGFFSKSLTGIRTLISNQREQVKKETGKFPKNILLVGGLGSSLHVYNELNQVFDGTVLRALNGWSAVAQGAVIQVLLDNLSLRAIYDAKQRKHLPRAAITGAKQSQTSPFKQAYGSHAGSTGFNQDNRQEKEHQHEPEGGRLLVLNDCNQTATTRQIEQNALKETIIKQNELIECLRKDLSIAENELSIAQQQHDKEVAELKKTVATLRDKVAENATRSMEMPLQLPLHCPEGEIVSAWHNLNYDVRIHNRGLFLPVPPKSKPLEIESSGQFSIPHPNSPCSVEETTEEEEYDSEAENTRAPNEHYPTDPGFEGKAVDDSMEEKLQRSEAKLRAVQQRHKDKVEELKETIEILREKLADKSSGSVWVRIQLPLHTPDSDIINAWHNLDYDVGNLVQNHFKGSKESKMVAWAQRQKDHLQELTPYYVEAATDKKCAAAFVEAAIWNALCMCTFGPHVPNGPFFWAGKYKRQTASMSDRLLSDVRKSKSDRYKAIFHQWEALTANLISVTISKEDRDKENAGITEDLNDFLDGLTSSFTPWAYRTSLRTIVDKAVELGMRLCAQQQNRYYIDWPGERRYNTELDRRCMKPVSDNPSSTRVRFMVRPGLFRHDDDHDGRRRVIDSCRVCAYD